LPKIEKPGVTISNNSKPNSGRRKIKAIPVPKKDNPVSESKQSILKVTSTEKLANENERGPDELALTRIQVDSIQSIVDYLR